VFKEFLKHLFPRVVLQRNLRICGSRKESLRVKCSLIVCLHYLGTTGVVGTEEKDAFLCDRLYPLLRIYQAENQEQPVGLSCKIPLQICITLNTLYQLIITVGHEGFML